MNIGFITAALAQKPLETVLEWLTQKGVHHVELAVRMRSDRPHVPIDDLLQDASRFDAFCAMLSKHGMKISALGCHGNPVHPQESIAAQDHRTFEQAVLLAEKLQVDRLITFSGCPGDCAASQYPNWVTCTWPQDYREILEYQWNDVLIPYWQKAADFARRHGVNKICIEMHPGFCVYNPETLLRLRAGVGSVIGANFDPSHLFWQGIDPVPAIRALGDAIYHVHAKDVQLNPNTIAVNGVLDTKPYSLERERAWIFRTVGFGHDAQTWKNMISALRLAGYDGTLSIEHEDSLMSVEEGAAKAIAFLKEIVPEQPSDGIWWD